MLEIRLLGELAIAREGVPLALPKSRKTLALLAYLAATGRRHRRDRLCSLLWELPDDPRDAFVVAPSVLEGERNRMVPDHGERGAHGLLGVVALHEDDHDIDDANR